MMLMLVATDFMMLIGMPPSLFLLLPLPFLLFSYFVSATLIDLSISLFLDIDVGQGNFRTLD